MLRSAAKLPLNILDLQISNSAGQEQLGLNGSFYDVLVGQSFPSVYDALPVGDKVDQEPSSASSDRDGTCRSVQAICLPESALLGLCLPVAFPSRLAVVLPTG